MRGSEPRAIYRQDYRPPDFLIRHTALSFLLTEDGTEVSAELALARNAGADPSAPLVLDGFGLETLEVQLDGETLAPERYRLEAEALTIEGLGETATLRTRVRIHPESNDSMEGLYHSGRMYCTQCEAEGFRRITWYLDRPDVLSSFETRIEAPRARYPVLLSNGNLVAEGDADGGRHWVRWQNPHPMPCYLFAMVAGDLARVDSAFTTMSGREIALRLYTEAENLHKTGHALDALRRAMRWDESVYGREYDLDIFMIVAVNDFNMGAMENKGLNIFNASCVLADPRSATDQAYERIEAIVAHEYFHNWSGNRVTCRDWFQLSLKEGFTVFRDQCFSADMGSAAVKRIHDVAFLRTAQFAEDAGPLAHPVRPDQYIEISNFYTLTVYEKGAEVVRMLHTLLGPERFRRGADLYFERHDGQAVTCDDFVQAMQDASGRDLAQFRRWYSQTGTPRLLVSDRFDAEQGEYWLRFEQAPGASEGPLTIPVRLGLLDAEGGALPVDCEDVTGDGLLVLEQPVAEYRFRGLAGQPVPSLLRGFSAPVRLQYRYSDAQLRLLARHDSDAYVRWDAGQRLYKAELEARADTLRAADRPAPAIALQGDFVAVAEQALAAGQDDDCSMFAQLLSLPSEAWLAEEAEVIHPVAIHAARESLATELAIAARPQLESLYRQSRVSEPYAYERAQCGRRALANTCLGLLVRCGADEIREACLQQFAEADNMTDQAGALRALIASGWRDSAEQALDSFLQTWRHDPLVVDQWLAMQASSAHLGDLPRVRGLLQHPVFDFRNPNKIRALIGSFAGQNPLHFHAEDGSGYAFLSEQVLRLDAANPQIAARLLGNFANWRRFDEGRSALMRAELEKVRTRPGLSRDSFEIAERALQPVADG